MMYRLTLTRSERKAIDWVGHRYSNGDDLRNLLDNCSYDGESEWDGEGDITFVIPEAIAWKIRENNEENDNWPCFSDDLSAKMQAFVDSIV